MCVRASPLQSGNIYPELMEMMRDYKPEEVENAFAEMGTSQAEVIGKVGRAPALPYFQFWDLPWGTLCMIQLAT